MSAAHFHSACPQRSELGMQNTVTHIRLRQAVVVHLDYAAVLGMHDATQALHGMHDAALPWLPQRRAAVHGMQRRPRSALFP
jgi:hypothetical protein